MTKEDFILIHISNRVVTYDTPLEDWAFPSTIVNDAHMEAELLWKYIPDELKSLDNGK